VKDKKIKKIYLIINEQHSLLPDQRRVLEERFPEANVGHILIPAKGLDLDELRSLYSELLTKTHNISNVIVMVSPIPAIIKWLPSVYVFFNSQREKKELPNGKIIFTVAKEGWELI